MKLVSCGNSIYASAAAINNPLTSILTRAAVSVTRDAMRELHRLMILPDDQRVVIRGLSESNGEFHYVRQTIYLSPFRESMFQFVETLCHECVHAEQYFTNRFGFLLRNEETYIRYGETLFQYDEETHDEMTKPWEQEAYARQEGLAKAVCKSLGGINVIESTAARLV